MTRVALRGLLGRKLRAVLTAFAIVLGVAMVSGTFVLTDTIKAAFTTVFTTVYQNTDAVISGKSAISSSNNGNAPTTPSLPASLLPRVQALPSVALASGGISDSAQLVGRNGKVISSGGAPGLAFSYSHAGEHFNPLTLKSGHFPTAPNEIDIDASTASKHNYAIGDDIGVVARGPVRRYQIVGTVEIGGVSSLGGATIAIFTLPEAQRIFNKVGQYDTISVAARHGYSPQDVVNQIKPLLGPSAQVKTGQQQAQQATKDTSGFLNIFQDFLLAFGGIALFVGSFVIANTLSITIAQRTRELATLRTLGATRRQVLRSVLVEAFVIGTLASIIGLFLGLLLAKGLNSLLDVVRDQPAPDVHRVQDPDGHRRARGRDHHHDDRGPAAGAAGYARGADRRGPRGRAAPPSRWAKYGTACRLRNGCHRGRADADRAPRLEPVDRSAAARGRRRRRGAVHRRVDARAQARAAAGPRARLAGVARSAARRASSPKATRRATPRVPPRPRPR